MQNTWATGLNPTFNTKLDPTRGRMLLTSMMIEESDPLLDVVDKEFLVKILDKRIEVMKLPITFTRAAKLAALSLVDRPGSMVALLIDCLNAYEGTTVTPQMLVELYPTGFYDEATLMRYIDNYLKRPPQGRGDPKPEPRKVKWAEVYE